MILPRNPRGKKYTCAASEWRPLLPNGPSHTFFLQGNNDDLILSCCLHYCKDKAKDFMPTNKGTVLPLPQDHPPPCPPSSALGKGSSTTNSGLGSLINQRSGLMQA